MSEFFLPEIKGQAIGKVMASAQLSGAGGNYLVKLVPELHLAGVAGNYLRDARVLNMTAPLYVADVVGQAIGAVRVTSRLCDVSAVVLMARDEKVIPPAPGGIFQKRIY